MTDLADLRAEVARELREDIAKRKAELLSLEERNEYFDGELLFNARLGDRIRAPVWLRARRDSPLLVALASAEQVRRPDHREVRTTRGGRMNEGPMEVGDFLQRSRAAVNKNKAKDGAPIDWIDVTQAMPDADQTVLLYAPGASEPVWPGYYDEENPSGPLWRYADTIEAPGVTHWAPMPAGPR